MLRASISFFLLGLAAILLGLYRIAGVSFETGRTLLFAFVALAVLTFLGSLVSGRRIGPHA